MMTRFTVQRSAAQPLRSALLALGLITQAVVAQAQAPALSADEDAALNLEVPTPDTVRAGAGEAAQPVRPWSLTSEIGAVSTSGRAPWPDEGATRASLALRGQATIAPGWDAHYAARLDAFDTRIQAFAADHLRTASLLEGYASHAVDAQTTVQLGRINVREGNAYSFNPTDYYRARSVKLFVNPSPMVTRESRQGTFGVRGLWLQPQGSLSLLYSPKLGSRQDSTAWGLDQALTNPAHSVMGVWSRTLSQSANIKLLGLRDSAGQWQAGLNGSALATDALTLHAEFSRGRATCQGAAVVACAQGRDGQVANQWAAGGTWTTGAWSWTAEHAYNGQAASAATFAGWAATAPAQALAYLSEAERGQSPNTRRSWFLHTSRTDLVFPRLDLRAFVRYAPQDHSRLAWLELRRRFDGFDLAYQLLASQGRSGSVYGILPARTTHQVVFTHHL